MTFLEIISLLFMAAGALGGLAFFIGLVWRLAVGGAWVTSRSYTLIHRLFFIGLAVMIGCGAVGLLIGTSSLAGR